MWIIEPQTDSESEMASSQLTLLPFSPGRRVPSSSFRCGRIRCASERQALFSRIAPVYDNVRLFLILLSFLLSVIILGCFFSSMIC